jgi:hypothetical protein
LVTAARAPGGPELAAGLDLVGLAVDVLVTTGAVETTGVGTCCVVACDGALTLGFGAAMPAVGASGVGASGCDRVAVEEADDPLAGASAIRGAASLRAPTGGLSGVGPDAAKAGAESAAASSMEHAATAIPLRRSVLRRDDVPVDIGPSLFR